MAPNSWILAPIFSSTPGPVTDADSGASTAGGPSAVLTSGSVRLAHGRMSLALPRPAPIRQCAAYRQYRTCVLFLSRGNTNSMAGEFPGLQPGADRAKVLRT